MKNVAFYLNLNNNWMGGVNYYRNLFKALSLIDTRFKYYIFMPESGKEFNFERYTNIEIIYDDLFIKDIRNTLNSYLKKYNISILSHMNVFSDAFDCKIVNWIPDFQHRYLPEFFSEEEINSRNEKYELYAKYADIVLLSSNDAKKDFINFIPNYKEKAKVLNFTPFIDIKNMDLDLNNKEKFFFLPNQFWQHKNHIIVFKVIKLLKDKNISIKLYCSGNLNDYRFEKHKKNLLEYIKDNKLEDNIKILGLISYEEMLSYMINSIAVINPSLFEGWSSTVEECKVLDKLIVLSNLDVHREQNPKGIYFNPNNIDELLSILKKLWIDNVKDSYFDKESLNIKMINNLKIFANNYEEKLLEII